MNVGIYYFSGTGNTRWIANHMSACLMDQGHQVEVESIESMPKIQNKDLIIIGGPIYAGNMPEKLIRWTLREIPETLDKKAIIFTSSAGLANANGVYSIGKKLQKKGYNTLGLLKYVLPRNFYLDGYEETEPQLALEEFQEAKKQVAIDMDILSMTEIVDIEEKVFGMDMLAEVMSIMTRFMGRKFTVTNDCIKCLRCEKSCPTQNITISKKIKFHHKCMMCTRCIHSCPENAILYKGQKFKQYKVVYYKD